MAARLVRWNGPDQRRGSGMSAVPLPMTMRVVLPGGDSSGGRWIRNLVINEAKTGQFERTLIIARAGSDVMDPRESAKFEEALVADVGVTDAPQPDSATSIQHRDAHEKTPARLMLRLSKCARIKSQEDGFGNERDAEARLDCCADFASE